jgi:RNA polymerase sigma-70 factor (ECF subfamily)
MPDDVDGDLLARFVRGDQAAFEALFRQFERDVYGWIVRIVRDTTAAEDAVVDAFWRAYRARARFDPSRSFGAWMRRIATNAALDQCKRLRRIARATDLRSHPRTEPPEFDGLRDTVRAALGALPAKLYVVAVLALIEERSYAEIAEALDVPIGTVRSRVHRATRALRTELGRRGVTG